MLPPLPKFSRLYLIDHHQKPLNFFAIYCILQLNDHILCSNFPIVISLPLYPYVLGPILCSIPEFFLLVQQSLTKAM